MDWTRKLTSRKFWAAIASFVSMLVVALGGEKEAATEIVALIMAGASVIAYIIGEGMADAAGAAAVWTVEDAADTGIDNATKIDHPPEVGGNG